MSCFSGVVLVISAMILYLSWCNLVLFVHMLVLIVCCFDVAILENCLCCFAQDSFQLVFYVCSCPDLFVSSVYCWCFILVELFAYILFTWYARSVCCTPFWGPFFCLVLICHQVGMPRSFSLCHLCFQLRDEDVNANTIVRRDGKVLILRVLFLTLYALLYIHRVGLVEAHRRPQKRSQRMERLYERTLLFLNHRRLLALL